MVDAPIGYISITENSIGIEKFESFWKDPDTKLIQFMAKDNVFFHSVIFPTTLRGSGYSNIQNIDIVSTDYLLYEGTKFSKSKNTGLFCDDIIKISKKLDIPPDYLRAYLVSIRPESGDSNFVLNDDGGFVDFVNNVLIKNFGNLIHRVFSVAYHIHTKHNITTLTHKYESLTDLRLDNECHEIIKEYQRNMDTYSLCNGIKTALKYSSRLNLCINEFTLGY